MIMSTPIHILAGARTAMAEYVGTPGGGAFHDVSAIELGAHATRAALERSAVEPSAVDHVVMGNVLQTSVDAIYGARHVGLHAGIPIETPALTLNRLCGSGLQAVISGAQLLQLGEADVVVAGGMENMSQAPHVVRGARRGLRLGQGQLEDSLMASLRDPYCGLFMAETAEKLAGQYGVGREEQDQFALESIQRATAARDAGRLAEEIAPYEIAGRRGAVTVVDQDDHLRTDTTLEKLAKLRPAFAKDGTVTAGNASGIVDGGAALVLSKDSGAPRLGTVQGWATVGVDPSIMGIGPAPAIRAALGRSGIELDDVDLFEINEAFSGQYLAVEKELGIDRSKANVNGGAIALGHPLGMTGARLLLTLVLELRRRQARTGVAAACIGGGQGIAVVVTSE